MKIYNSLTEINKELSLGLTIGNFDGVHIGHRDLINRINKDCEKKSLELVVMTFVPHPLEILRGKSKFLINTYVERRKLLEEIGVKHLVELTFDRDFSTQSPEDFLEREILSCTQVKKLYLGYDFAFGANKAGDYNFVKSYCEGKGLESEIEPEFQFKNEVMSSTLVRESLVAGKMKMVNDYLGRNFFLSGRIYKGDGRGRTIGFPTANMEYPKERILPKKGVYITETIYKDMRYFSVTNVGNNPTFLDKDEIFVETHILNFDNDIYGEEIKVEFFEFLRGEKKFPSVNDLIEQIKLDIKKARAYFD